MARTAQEHLDQLLTIRDALTDLLVTWDGVSTIEVSVRGRTHRFTSPIEDLERLRQLIKKAQAEASAEATNPARNVVRRA